jgi:iron complex outermembrane receptor protein
MDVSVTRTPLALCALLASGALHAADAGGGRNDEAPLEEVTVVGSHIAGGGAAEALSVATVGKDEIESIGATNGNELFRSLPQFGDVAFTEKS